MFEAFSGAAHNELPLRERHAELRVTILAGKQKSNYNKGKRSMKTGVLDMYGRFHQVR